VGCSSQAVSALDASKNQAPVKGSTWAKLAANHPDT